MNKEDQEQEILTACPKDDVDSGLDNTSDSGHSNDDVFSASSSDYDDSLNSDNEKDSCEKKSSRASSATSQVPPPESASERDVMESALDVEQLKEISPESSNPSTKQGKIEKNEKYHAIRIVLNRVEPLENEHEEAVAFFTKLMQGQEETMDFSIDSQAKKPDWLDEDKFKRGQKFAREHLFCLNFAEMVSLFILFAQKASLGPLIFTGKSDAPYTAFQRYLSTLSRLISWYTDDLWNDNASSGVTNLSLVRGMHKKVFNDLTKGDPKEIRERIQLGDPNTTALWCPLKDLLLQDFTESVAPPILEYLEFGSVKKVWINQADMSITQFGFVGLAVLYPKAFGLHLASDEDLDAFLHMWKGLGYLLGIKDEYNYCNGDLETVRKRTKFFVEVVVKPSFREVACDWEHMCRCLTSGIAFYLPQVNFESALLYLCDILEISTPRLRKQITYYQYIIYQLHRLVFYLMKFRGVLPWLNARLYLTIKKAQTAPPETLSKWENRQFEYMNQPGKCPIRGHFVSTKL